MSVKSTNINQNTERRVLYCYLMTWEAFLLSPALRCPKCLGCLPPKTAAGQTGTELTLLCCFHCLQHPVPTRDIHVMPGTFIWMCGPQGSTRSSGFHCFQPVSLVWLSRLMLQWEHDLKTAHRSLLPCGGQRQVCWQCPTSNQDSINMPKMLEHFNEYFKTRLI